MRTPIIGFLLVALIAAEPASLPIKPTTVTLKKPNAVLGEVAVELSKSPAGVKVIADRPDVVKLKCPVAFAETPFWNALETAADETKTRLILRDAGRTVVLEPRPREREISAVCGPFRVVPRMVIGRFLLDQDKPFHDVQLDVHWEPRVPVFRIDSHPKITKATDDRGMPLTVAPGSTLHYPSGSLTEMSVRLSGLTRASKHIGVLAGEFRATAAEKMLAVRFDDLSGGFPLTKTESGVKITLKSFTKSEKTWDAELELRYPAGHPTFESFEEQKWLRDNRLRLWSPDKKPIEPDSEDVTASGPNVTATYRFKMPHNPTAKGWALVCETPAPLVEMKVPFELKNIPIP